MQDSLNYDGLKHFYLLSSALSELNNLKGKSGSIATIVDTGAEYMYEESSEQWHLQPSSGGGVSEQWVKDWVKAHSIESYPTLPSPQDVGNNKAIWDETGKRLLTPNGNEFVELVPAIRKVNEIVNTGNENVFYKKTGGIFYEGARVSHPLKSPVFYKITDPENLIVLDWGGVRVGETSIAWEAVDDTYISSWVNSGYIAQCTHLDSEAEIWGGIDGSTWIYNSVKYSGATIADDELVYIDSFGVIRQVTDNSKIGDLAQLATEEKSNLVGAINEVKEKSIAILPEEPATPDYSRFFREEGGYKYDGNRIHNLKFYAIADAYKQYVQAEIEGLHYTGEEIIPWSEINEVAIQALIDTSQVEEVQTLEGSDFVGAFNSSDEFFSFCSQDTKLTYSTDIIKYFDKQGGYVSIPRDLEQILQKYQLKITAGAGLVFDGNTLKHSNSVTPKPQRYIRATAYDAQGHAINFGADYLVSRTDNNDNVLSDSYLSSTLWVHKHQSPIEASSFANKANSSIPVDDCVFDMENIGDSTDIRRSQKRYLGLAKLTNPINGTLLYGGIDVTEYWYQYEQEGMGNCRIEQVFRNSFNGDIGIVFKRFGGLAFSDAGEFGTAIYTNRSAIVWGNWIPIEYPITAITKESIVDEGAINFRVKAGMGIVDFSGLVVDEFSNPSAVLGTLPAGIQAVLSETKHYIGNNNGDMHGLNVTSNGNLQLWKKTGDVFPLSLSGTIMFPIGY